MTLLLIAGYLLLAPLQAPPEKPLPFRWLPLFLAHLNFQNLQI